jgi:hypothetical protein
MGRVRPNKNVFPAPQERGNTLPGVLVVDVLNSGIYDLWAVVEAP